MYIVSIINDGIKTQIHNNERKLSSGSVVKGINSIDSCSFKLSPFNIGFDRLKEYKTLVEVYNTNKKRYEFQGRIVYLSPEMSDSGMILKSATCESLFGYLCDSLQPYVEEQNWTVEGLFQHIIDQHNAQVEEHKRFALGEVTVTDPNDNLYLGIQRENTWETIKKKLLETLGGEIRFRVGSEGTIYIDYLVKIGETKATKIKLSRNLKAITKESDPSAFITRLIPLGCKLTKEVTSTDENGNTTTLPVITEERLEITSVNDGKNYIDDEAAIDEFGIIVGCLTFDDVTTPENLLQKGRTALAENNRVRIKYSVTALDLSVLGLDIDDFEVHNYHPIENKLLGIDDVARIIKKNINICDETKSTFDLGESFKTLSELQVEQSNKIESLTNSVGKIESNYVTNERLTEESNAFSSLIQQAIQSILLTVSETYAQKTGSEEITQEISTAIEQLARQINLKFTETTQKIEDVDGDLQSKFEQITTHFSFTINGFTIGKTNSPYKIFIDDNEFTMTVNDVPVLWFEITENAQEAHIPELTITRRFKIFGHLIEEDEDGNVNCEYVGGET